MVIVPVNECLLKYNECVFDPIAVNIYVQLINTIWTLTVAFDWQDVSGGKTSLCKYVYG